MRLAGTRGGRQAASGPRRPGRLTPQLAARHPRPGAVLTVFTVITRNYLHQARTLMESVAEHVPDAARRVVLIDRPEGFFRPEAERFEILFADEMGVANFRGKAFALDGAGICCLIKAIAALHLLQDPGTDRLLYLDGDTLLYRTPAELLAAAAAPLVFTPHFLAPAPTGRFPGDLELLQTGLLNAGLFTARNCEEARRMLRWWVANLEQPGRLRAEWAYDQAWLNLAQGYFPELGVLRDPGYNVAYWNLPERALSGTPASGVRVNGATPLTLFHYSFLDPAHPTWLAKRGCTQVPAPDATVLALIEDYLARLSRNGLAECGGWTYGFGQFRDGKPITDEHRQYYLDRVMRTAPDGDPFDPAFACPGASGLKSLYQADHPVTRLIRRVRLARNALLGIHSWR